MQLKPHQKAWNELLAHPLLGGVAAAVSVIDNRFLFFTPLPKGQAVRVMLPDRLFIDVDAKLSVAQWLGHYALGVFILASGPAKRIPVPNPLSDIAVQLAALHWWRHLRVGELPEQMNVLPDLLAWGRLPLETIVHRLRSEADNPMFADFTWCLHVNAKGQILGSFLEPEGVRSSWNKPEDIEARFAQALVDNAKRALQLQHDASHPAREGSNPNSTANIAKRWLATHYPLLGGMIVRFDIVEDTAVCRRLDISIAAIQVATNEIYINPNRALTLEQCKFVLAHEVLHAGLCHASRRQGRDAYLWNVACDFVINDWLVSMQVGSPPPDGLLFDEALRGQSADDIYIKLTQDLRVRRRLSTFRGQDVDMLDNDRFFTDQEAFCKNALLQGLVFHQANGRGGLPEGLVEDIRVLNQPPIPWQAKLAEWLQERFPLPERRRTYAKASRRQSATPDLPRPRFIEPEENQTTRTFGVIIDTSGSMSRFALGNAIGAVASYAQAQSVRQVRLVYCDATPYDEGYVDVDSLNTRVTVRGRGGTVLQPAVTHLQYQRDFPATAPILIITDGLCEDHIDITRDHAFLLPPGARLPFATRAPVFLMR